MTNLSTRREFIQLSAVTGLLALTGCSSNSRRKVVPRDATPTYSTNVAGGKTSDFRDEDFDAGVPLFDFGNSGKRIVGALGRHDKIVDMDGEPISGNVLPFWTLIYSGADIKTPEFGWDINRQSQNITLRKPDSSVRVYVEQPDARGITTSKKFVNRSVPVTQRIYTLNEPDFAVPGYRIQARSGPIDLFYATYAEHGQSKLAFIPNPDSFYLHGDRVQILGKVYKENWGRIKTAKPASPSEIKTKVNREAIVTGEFILAPATQPTSNSHKK